MQLQFEDKFLDGRRDAAAAPAIMTGVSRVGRELRRIRHPLDYVRPRVLRIGVTGLARSGKTVLLTSIAAALLSPGRAGLSARIRDARLSPSGAESLPRFEYERHLAALAADPPRWPERTDAVSLLALDLEIADPPLPARRVRLELLDYPGEWLLDLPLLDQGYEAWSASVLSRLQRPSLAQAARDFLGFVHGLPASAPADERLAEAGHRLYRTMLERLRDHGLSMLQPGRFLMPAPGASPPWERFFPMAAARGGALQSLLRRRYDAYVGAVREALASPLFGDMDRLVVLADLLGALHAGPDAFADVRAALAAAAGSLRWQGSWLDLAASLARLRLPPRVIRRVAFVASKSDHVAGRQRGNLAGLMRSLTAAPAGSRSAQRALAVAAARCTEDFVWTLEGRPVSAVRGRVLGERQRTRSYPGEVPDQPPDAAYWAHPFLDLPAFEPVRLPEAGRMGVPSIGLDALLGFLLEDVL